MKVTDKDTIDFKALEEILYLKGLEEKHAKAPDACTQPEEWKQFWLNQLKLKSQNLETTAYQRPVEDNR